MSSRSWAPPPFRFRGRGCALLRPAVPAGSDLWSSVPAYNRRPVLMRSRASTCFAQPHRVPALRLGRPGLACGAGAARRSAPERLLLLRACLLMRCPGRQRPLASRPKARAHSSAWSPALWGITPEACVRLAEPRARQRMAGGPLRHPLPSVRPGRASCVGVGSRRLLELGEGAHLAISESVIDEREEPLGYGDAGHVLAYGEKEGSCAST